MSFPWDILIGEAEVLGSEAVVSVFDDGGAADVVRNATSVDAAVDTEVDADCGWVDVARAWAEVGSYCTSVCLKSQRLRF